MAADPFAFYRGSACLFYADVADLDDPWADERTSRVWIQGDLHAENFGTYMDGDGVLIFDVNDFDEAYLGHFTWDVRRFAASMALLGWRKALSDDDITALVAHLHSAPTSTRSGSSPRRRDDREFALRLDTTEGPVNEVLAGRQAAHPGRRCSTRITETEGFDRRLRDGPGLRRLDDDERAEVVAAFERYVETIPEAKRYDSDVAYTSRTWPGAAGSASAARACPPTRAHRGLQPGAGQRRGALDEAGQRRGAVAAS